MRLKRWTDWTELDWDDLTAASIDDVFKEQVWGWRSGAAPAVVPKTTDIICQFSLTLFESITEMWINKAADDESHWSLVAACRLVHTLRLLVFRAPLHSSGVSHCESKHTDQMATLSVSTVTKSHWRSRSCWRRQGHFLEWQAKHRNTDDTDCQSSGDLHQLNKNSYYYNTTITAAAATTAMNILRQ